MLRLWDDLCHLFAPWLKDMQDFWGFVFVVLLVLVLQRIIQHKGLVYRLLSITIRNREFNLRFLN